MTETILAPTDSQLAVRLYKQSRRVGRCLRWTGYHNIAGYGKIGHAGKSLSVHRLAYRLWVGELPPDLHVDHLCLVRDCIEPTHLEAVPLAENARRVNARKTHCKRGHPLSGDNLYINAASGSRVCRTCAKEARARYWARPEKVAAHRVYEATEHARALRRERGRRYAATENARALQRERSRRHYLRQKAGAV